MQTICPDAVSAMDIEGASDDLQILGHIRVSIGDHGIRLGAEFLHRTALSDIIKALGWFLITDAQGVVDNHITSFQLVKRHSALAVVQDEFVFCLAIHLFLIKVRTWTAAGNEPVIRCKVKLWHVWVWDALVDASANLSMFEDTWAEISDLFQIHKLWRFAITGRCANPEWPLSGFIQMDESGNRELCIFMLPGLKGGGPVRLVTNTQAMLSDNFQTFAHLGASDSEKALTVAFEQSLGAMGNMKGSISPHSLRSNQRFSMAFSP